ncbi:hypothetical protein T4D_13780 [Trichinella pseudospiralis]|uniref:Uncharacterized protein n=1 Tax=Trichinella pseudospiralis TaxID=6337 RepID=A0A0V1FV66_TRIPS|nr:hypothetical protein T4D_13780 [Trichinella pseudospiralis]
MFYIACLCGKVYQLIRADISVTRTINNFLVMFNENLYSSQILLFAPFDIIVIFMTMCCSSGDSLQSQKLSTFEQPLLELVDSTSTTFYCCCHSLLLRVAFVPDGYFPALTSRVCLISDHKRWTDGRQQPPSVWPIGET